MGAHCTIDLPGLNKADAGGAVAVEAVVDHPGLIGDLGLGGVDLK